MKVVIISAVEPPPAFIRDVKEVLGVDDVKVIGASGVKACDVIRALKEEGDLAGVAVFAVGLPTHVTSKVSEFSRKHNVPLLAGFAVAVKKPFCGLIPKDRRVEWNGECLEYYALAEGVVTVVIPEKFVREYYGRKFPEYVKRSNTTIAP